MEPDEQTSPFRPVIITLGCERIINPSSTAWLLLTAVTDGSVLHATLKDSELLPFLTPEEPKSQITIHDHVPHLTRTKLLEMLPDDKKLRELFLSVLKHLVELRIDEQFEAEPPKEWEQSIRAIIVAEPYANSYLSLRGPLKALFSGAQLFVVDREPTSGTISIINWK